MKLFIANSSALQAPKTFLKYSPHIIVFAEGARIMMVTVVSSVSEEALCAF